MTKPNDPVSGQFHGLTKREYFAAMAVHGLSTVYRYDAAVRYAVKMADAIIDELNKTANDQPD